MGTTRDLERLRARLAETPRNGQGHRQYDDGLKRDVRQYARDRLRTGELALNAVAEEIGISGDTLWGWLHKGESSGGRRRRREKSLPEGAREFRAALEALGPRTSGATYAPELRSLAVEHVKRRRDEGAALREIASELGVGKDTLGRWIRPRARRSSKVRRVSIAAATPAAAMTIVVRGPAGLRIEGLDVSTIAALLRELS